MGAGGDGVGKTEAPKDAHVIICGVFAEETVIRRLGGNGRARSPVEDVCGGMEGLDPERGGRLAWMRRTRKMSLVVRIRRSALPFCGEV